MLPHSPWRYLPSGRRYDVRPAPGWGSDEVWSSNQAAVDQHWQRHLLQLGYADRVLGRLLDRMQATGLYDRATVVVTADHGVSFRAGQKRRPLSQANREDIAYVPLFVKTPGQRDGRIVPQPARTTDILPTLADAAGIRSPWRVDGHSLLRTRPAERTVVLVKDKGRRFVIPVAVLEGLRERALRRQLRLFGSGRPSSTLFAVGPDRGLLGHSFEGRHRASRLDAVDRSESRRAGERTRLGPLGRRSRRQARGCRRPDRPGPLLGTGTACAAPEQAAQGLRGALTRYPAHPDGRHRPGAPGALPPSS